MKVLVTGGAGYVGSRVVAGLLFNGHQVRVFDRLLYGAEALIPFSGNPNFELQVGDVRDAADVARATVGVDAVVHMAGIVGEDACKVDTKFAWSINREAIPNVLQGAAVAGVKRLVFVSTCSNYGIAEPNTQVDEDAPLKPISDYSRAKVEVEADFLSFNGVPTTTVLRLGTICGLSARMRFDLLVNEMARETTLDRTIEIFAPAAWRPFLHIDDAAEAIRRVLEADQDVVNRKVFNVVGENHQKTSLIEIAKAYAPQARMTVVEKKPDLRDYRVSGDRFVKALGFCPSRSVAQAFREMAEAVRDGVVRNPDWSGHSAVPLDGFASARRDS